MLYKVTSLSDWITAMVISWSSNRRRTGIKITPIINITIPHDKLGNLRIHQAFLSVLWPWYIYTPVDILKGPIKEISWFTKVFYVVYCLAEQGAPVACGKCIQVSQGHKHFIMTSICLAKTIFAYLESQGRRLKHRHVRMRQTPQSECTQQ